MHTYVIYEPDEAIRKQVILDHVEKLHISTFDCVSLAHTDPSIGIAETRLFIRSLSLSPQAGTHTAGIITHAHLLTAEAQQSLLKTLEEPPTHAYIFLGAENDQQLLSTIRSRSITITHTTRISGQDTQELSDMEDTLTRILHATPGEKIRLVQTIGKSKDDVDHWINVAIYVLRNAMLQQDIPHEESQKKTNLIHQLISAKKHLTNNIQPLLLVEHAILQIP